jgi:hypothetical protein
VYDAPTAQGGMLEQAFHYHVDGQQVTSTIAGGVGAGSWGQPRFSRDAIAEFEFVSSRFDATQGRSSGLQVNAVTKSGTNTFTGTLAGYFRDDSLIAKDHVVGRVLPYSDQQVSGTFGGPIERDRVHFFANYEYEREPQTFAFTSPFPRFNATDLSATRTEQILGARVDTQFSNSRRLMVRANGWRHNLPRDPRSSGGAALHPSVSNFINRWSGQGFATLTQTLGQRAVNETRGGWTGLFVDSDGIVEGSPTIMLRGYSIGKQGHYPLVMNQPTYQIRNDYSTILDRHQVKVGGEALFTKTSLKWINPLHGVLDATGGPVPANLEDLFPVWNDPSTWNLAALSPITVRWTQRFGDPNIDDPRRIGAAWLQDNWTVSDRLTLNLGLRWDVSVGQLAESLEVAPFKSRRGSEWANLGPRLGFAYNVSDQRTVIRGGFGKYFAETTDQPTHFTRAQIIQATAEVPNDGRPDFAANPFNGPAPTYEDILRGGAIRSIGNIAGNELRAPYSYQSSIGFQRQLAPTMAFEADYVWTGARRQQFTRQINLSYNPATQTNFAFTDAARRPYPEWGTVTMFFSEAWSNYHALETAFTKRYSDRWQVSATYTLSALWSGQPPLLRTDQPLAPDLDRQYSLAPTDQRHRAVVNGIWDLPLRFQVSGLYFYGSGERYAVTCGCGDLRRLGAGTTLLRADGTMIPREGFAGDPIHRVDVRLQRRVPLAGRATIDGIVEVFNAFNRANYGSYVTIESNRSFRQPVQNTNIAYAPRTVQLGFRLTF